jgi:hypothetical protein
MVGELDPYSDTLRDTTKNFSEISRAFTIRSFYEQKLTRLPPPEGDQYVSTKSKYLMSYRSDGTLILKYSH